jgi:general secretion pathway protein C
MDVPQFVRKRFGTLLLLPVPWLAFLNADGVACLVKANLPSNVTSFAASRSHAKEAPPFHENSSDAILARNPFDSVTGSLVRKPAASSAPSDLPEPFDAPSCEGVRVLAIASSADPDWSFAALQRADEPTAILRRRGGAFGAKTVAYVGWDRVWMESEGGHLCQCTMFDAAAVPVPVKDEHERVTASPSTLPKEIRNGIHARSATEFDVDRGVLEQVLRDQASLLGSTRVRIETVNGQPAGVKLAGVAPESLLGAVGLENGDRLETINGFEVAKPESALQAYARLPQSDHLVLKVSRGGKEIEIDYDIK